MVENEVENKSNNNNNARIKKKSAAVVSSFRRTYLLWLNVGCAARAARLTTLQRRVRCIGQRGEYAANLRDETDQT